MRHSRAVWLLAVSAFGAMFVHAFISNSHAKQKASHVLQNGIHHRLIKKANLSGSSIPADSDAESAVFETRENREESVQTENPNPLKTDTLIIQWMSGQVLSAAIQATATQFVPLLSFFLIIFTLSLPPPAVQRA